MVNGRLAYGVPLNKTSLNRIVDILRKTHDDVSQLVESVEAAEEDYHAMFEGFEGYFMNVRMDQNGACCCIEEDYPYFLGWFSDGSNEGDEGSFPVDLPSNDQLQRINSELAIFCPKKRPGYYVMAYDCHFCT